MKSITIAMSAVIGLGLLATAPADEIEFVTLPDVVRSTVVRETEIPDYTRVRRVVRQDDGIYEVTVRRDTDDYVVYVDSSGTVIREQPIVRRGTVDQTTTETIESTEPTRTIRTYESYQQNPRYRLIEKDDEKKSTGTWKPVRRSR